MKELEKQEATKIEIVAKQKKQATKIVMEDCLVTTDQKQQMENIDKTTNKIVKSILATQICLNTYEVVKQIKDQNNKPIYFKQEVKKLMNLLLPQLIKLEAEHFDMLYDKSDKSTSEVYDLYNHFINVISEIEIYEMPEILNLITAYQIDKKSINGIVNKTLKLRK